ncbi:TPA: cation:proton antiporter [Pasteurella multocida]|nr:cation:proton antiporter [Pasteurella multocida]HDR1908217.1 cation:proton antiporter [Pasteurella multocida]
MIQIVIILIFSKIVSILAKKLLNQTDVAGEILAGILLGPSCLTLLFPNFFKAIFTNETLPVFTGLSQIGLIFLMFQIGMEFDFSRQLKGKKMTFLLISIAGIIFPFTIGFFTADYFWNFLADPKPNLFGFKLFFSIAMSITAIPILGRIFMELNYSSSRISTIIISSAAIDDAIGWILLGIITTLVTSHFSAYIIIKNIILLILAGLLIFLLVINFYLEKLNETLKRIKR